MVDLAVVIVSYNVKTYLLACLASLYRQRPLPSMEVVVVDNVSSDGSAEAVQRAFPQVRVLANASNVGFAAANNQGACATAAPHVLFLNPDTEVQEGTLAALLQFAEAHPQAALLTCRLLNSDGTLQHSCFHFPSLRMAFYGFFPLVPMDAVENGRYPAAQYERAFAPEHILGACLLVRREALEAVGGWDEGYFMYFEETDLCQRLRRAGYRALYTPQGAVVHHGGRSTAALPERMSLAFYRSQSRYYRRHLGPVRYLALKGIVVAGLAFWLSRTCRGLLRRRISWATFCARLHSYAGILVA